jgi:hypothetical protein
VHRALHTEMLRDAVERSGPGPRETPLAVVDRALRAPAQVAASSAGIRGRSYNNCGCALTVPLGSDPTIDRYACR